MSVNEKQRAVFDPILGMLETVINGNAAAILAEEGAIGLALTNPIRRGLSEHRSRAAQFALIHRAIEQGEVLFQQSCAGLPKEVVMAIARRAPTSFLDGADLLLATLIVKHTAPDEGRSWSMKAGDEHALALLVTPEEIGTVCRLISIAKTMNHLRGMARWLGKGGKLILETDGTLRVQQPAEVTEAVKAYDRRRVHGRLFDGAGFFSPQPDPAKWTQYRIPALLDLHGARMIEAPVGSDRWISFERWPTMVDGGGLANLLRAYETPLLETYGVGADPILHFLTALAVLIHDNSPGILGSADRLAFRTEASPEATEHKIGFAFGIARKGFIRFPRGELIHNVGRVRTPLAPDQAMGEALGAAFIDAFLLSSETTGNIDAIAASQVPFLHASTGDHLYIDVLLIGEFLNGLIEKAKSWYASQHGDRFLLDLKRWLDEVAPGAIAGARRPVKLENGAQSDIDLLARDATGLVVVECKAYAKSKAFLVGAPTAIAQRRRRIAAAVAQARRTAQAFAQEVTAGKTEFAAETPVRAMVCSPSTEFLLPLDEHGMAAPEIPNVLTPEDLLEVLA